MAAGTAGEDRSVGQAPSSEELIGRAASLVPLLRRNALEGERLRRLPDENVRALEEAGLLRIALPVARGGYGADPAVLAKVMTSIASGCAATAWVTMIYNSVAQLAELLPEAALAEIHADPHPKVAGVFGMTGAVVDPVDGGYRVRGGGRWPFNSGCHHATWDLLRVGIAGPDGTTTPAFAAAPMAELTIEDDWHVMGAAATGSHSVSCGEIFLPGHRVAPMAGSAKGALRSDLGVAQSVSLPLGMARHALEAFLDLARSQGHPHLGHARMAAAPAVQVAATRAAVIVKLIEAYQYWAMTSGEASDPALAAATQAGCVRLAREAIDTLFDACPSSEIRLDRPIQRLARDIQTFEHQHSFSPFVAFELYGRTLCQG